MTGLEASARARPSGPARPVSTLPDRLRSETRDAHDAAERALDWERRVATVGGYRDLLGRWWGFHAAWEPAAAAVLAEPSFLEPRRKLELLRADLSRLGASSDEIAGLPVLRPGTAWWQRRADVLGTVYVLEGSSLGGQIIGRRIAATFGFGRESGCSYFNAYGAGVGAMWRETRERLALVPAEEHDTVVAAASATFERLRDWLASPSG